MTTPQKVSELVPGPVMNALVGIAQDWKLWVDGVPAINDGEFFHLAYND